MSEIIVTTGNFEQEVLKADKPVLVDFWAPWCGPCRMLAPVVEEIAEELSGKAVVGKVNVDEQGDLAMRFGISSIPSILIFDKGALKSKTVGVQSKAALKKQLGF